MLSCWQLVPKTRPLFNELEEKITKMMDRSVSQHYIVMNEPYLKMNINRFSIGQTDYIAGMSSPDCPSPPIPDTGPNFQEYIEQSRSKSGYANIMEFNQSSDTEN